MLRAGEGAAGGHRGHGDGALDTTQARAGVDSRGEPPGRALVAQCRLQAPPQRPRVGELPEGLSGVT